MPSDQKPASPDQAQLVEYQVWDRVERRLWSRARLILGAVVVLTLVVALLGVPLVEERIERRVTERADSLIAQGLAAEGVDVPALREEIRQESASQRQELLRSQVILEKRIATVIERTAELKDLSETYAKSADEYENLKAQMRAVQQSQKNEEERLHRLRTTHEKELSEFRDQSKAIMEQVPKLARRELKFLEATVNRDLDELRLIIADQVAGKPAIYSTYVNIAQRDGQITGVGFGEDRGNVFMRLRAFDAGAATPFFESDSIMLQSTGWNETRINLRFPAPALEKIQEARQEASSAKTKPPSYRYGFVVQTAKGSMSQWSGLRTDTFIPPTSVAPKDD